jgi:hypothetical protein
MTAGIERCDQTRLRRADELGMQRRDGQAAELTGIGIEACTRNGEAANGSCESANTSGRARNANRNFDLTRTRGLLPAHSRQHTASPFRQQHPVGAAPRPALPLRQGRDQRIDLHCVPRAPKQIDIGVRANVALEGQRLPCERAVHLRLQTGARDDQIQEVQRIVPFGRTRSFDLR